VKISCYFEDWTPLFRVPVHDPRASVAKVEVPLGLYSRWAVAVREMEKVQEQLAALDPENVTPG